MPCLLARQMAGPPTMNDKEVGKAPPTGTGGRHDDAIADDADYKDCVTPDGSAVKGVFDLLNGQSYRYSYKRLLAPTLNKAALSRFWVTGRLLVPQRVLLRLGKGDALLNW